jgi:type I restriction enzyme, S subunit
MKQSALKNKVFEDRKPFSNSTIPNDWVISTVGDAFEICNNLRYPISEEERRKIQGNYPYYGPTKIQDYINEYRLDGKYSLIGEDGDHFLKWKELPMTLLIEGKFNVNNHAHVVKGTTNITEWFFYYFNQKELTPYITRQGAGRYKLTKQSLEKIPVPLPTISEQKAITAILISCDLNIKLIEQLLVQKKLRKKWLMQQLLTGKKRLKGFGGEWTEMQLGDFIIESRIPSINNDVNKRITVKLNLKGIEKRDVRGSEAEGATYYFIRKKCQFIYGKQNLHKGAFGIIPDELDGFESSQDIPTFDFQDGVSPSYFMFFMSQESFYQSLEKISTGTGSKRIHPENLFKVNVKFPPIKEQTAIAQVLQAADKEISLLKAKAEKLRVQKKGLMQQLLTGKIRIR